MYRIYYKRWTSNICWLDAHITVENVIIPEDNIDIEITSSPDNIYYLYELFGGSISDDKKSLLLAKLPEDIIKIKKYNPDYTSLIG